MCIMQEITLMSSQESYIKVLGVRMQGRIREFIQPSVPKIKSL